MQNQLSVSNRIEFEHVDLNRRWTPAAILNAMQTIADQHALSLGAGRDAVLARGGYWIIARILLTMRRYPVYGDAVSLSTWPGEPDRISFPRYFKFEDAAGERLGGATTKYMLLSAEDHSILSPAKFELYNGLELLRESNPQPKKIQLGAAARVVGRRAPAYSDIDLNRHMNNTRYAQWVCDLFPTARYERETLASFQLNYISDGIEGHPIELQLEETGGGFSARGADTKTGKTVFESAGQWQPVSD